MLAVIMAVVGVAPLVVGLYFERCMGTRSDSDAAEEDANAQFENPVGAAPENFDAETNRKGKRKRKGKGK